MKTRVVTPELILAHICQGQLRDRTHIIMGRSGPTGKTWLCRQLKERGFNAIELSEHIYNLVDYPTERNHYLICNDAVIIILNEILPKYRKDLKGEN